MIVTRIENENEFLKENPKRDMNNIEIYGAMYLLYLVSKEYYDAEITIEDIDYMTYYCNKSLQIIDGIRVDYYTTIESVFMLGNNKEDLFAYAYDDSDEELFLVRVG